MFDEDELPFLRAILANPADAALKLVYADWLQERDDPRAEYVRLRARPRPTPDALIPVEVMTWPAAHKSLIDTGWLAFILTLAEPFEPGVTDVGDPFADAIGTRGWLAVLESQFHDAAKLDAGLLSDLWFVLGLKWGECAFGFNGGRIYKFVCELAAGHDPDTESGLRAALGVEKHRAMLVTTAREDQSMFGHDFHWSMCEAHDTLRDYVAGQLKYVSLTLDRRADDWRREYPFEVVAVVGRSPHGDRLVGAMGCGIFHT